MSEQTLLDAVEAQRGLAREIHAVRCDQLGSLDAEDYARLQLLLDARQALLSRLSPLQFPPDDWERYAASRQDHILTLRAEVERLLKEILVMDQIARQKIESHRDELQAAIREVRRGRQGLAGYRQALEP